MQFTKLIANDLLPNLDLPELQIANYVRNGVIKVSYTDVICKVRHFIG